jgi:hypothetical protein
MDLAVSSSMKNNTYSRRSQTVSTVKKSQARIPAACWRRNAPPRHGRSPWCGVRGQAMAAERFADHGRRDPHVEAEQFALDPLVAPAGIVLCQAGRSAVGWLHQAVDGRTHDGDRSTLWRPGGGAAQQRLRLDEEARLAGPRQHAANGSQQGPIGRLEPWVEESGGATRRASGAAPGSPDPWQGRRGRVGRAVGWCGTA